MASMAERHLAQAERHIVQAELRVTRQRRLLDRLAAGGHGTAAAEELLATLLAHLEDLWVRHTAILAKIAAADQPGLP
jgi:hypothetical protein